jgi:NAD(P)-dependent dehydrogenase (short-subunit alcohol dehydrogenase family)
MTALARHDDPVWRGFAGRHAVVTGAGRGIGRDIALALAGAGAVVTAIARSADDLDEVAELAAAAGGGAVRACTADVRDAEALDAVIAGAEADLLVTSAGINRPGPLTEIPLEDVLAILEINITGTVLTCRSFGRAAIAADRAGAAVIVSSQMGSVGYPGRAPYCASKHAVNGLTKALALEWAPHHIRVNAVAPTFIRTPFTAPMFADPAFAQEVLARIPLGRIGEVADVTGAARFLLSDEAALITGHVLAVDGGWTAQ